jgi:hypothetical protein
MKGDMALSASRAGAPCGVRRDASLAEIDANWVALEVVLETTAQALPSCGCRVVVSLSRYRLAEESQRRALAVDLMDEVQFCQVGMTVASLRTVAKLKPRLIV